MSRSKEAVRARNSHARDQSAEALYGAIAARYEVSRADLAIAGIPFSVLHVNDTNALLESLDPETFVVDERLPYWADLWASSVVLAEWCLRSCVLEGKNVLELGSGLGLGGLAAARAGGRVVMTDYEEDALLFARYNAHMNIPEQIPEIRLMDWRAPDIGDRYDFILGADLIYEQRNFKPLLGAFGKLLLPGGRVILTDPDRSIGVTFVSLAREAGWSVQSVRSMVVHFGRAVSVMRYELCLPAGIVSQGANV